MRSLSPERRDPHQGQEERMLLAAWVSLNSNSFDDWQAPTQQNLEDTAVTVGLCFNCCDLTKCKYLITLLHSHIMLN